MANGQAPIQMDLEKEMTCSICTDILYEPLTLLDCLHTFCGACLKEWFKAQASRAQSLHPYTCPACRASVRGTKYNAWVHTMLDIFLQAHPEKGRNEEERQEADKIYKRGDNVLPKLRRRGRHRDNEEEQRLVNETVALSLQDAGISAGPSEGGEGRRRDTGAVDSRGEERQVGMYLHSREEPRHRARLSPRRGEAPVVLPERAVEHQSSLRSLLSGSEENIQEEIMRQIAEEGLLDGIDTENLTTSQEDEISERIAAAYRTRQEQRRRERRDRSRDRSSHRPHNRSRRNSNQQTPTSREQISLPSSPTHIQSPAHAQPPANTEQASRANLSAHTDRHSRGRHRSNSATNTSTPRSRSVSGRPAASSTSNLPLQTDPQSSEGRRPTDASRRTTDPAGARSLERQPTSGHVSHTGISLHRPPPRSGSDGHVPPPHARMSPRIAASTFPLDIASARSSNSALNISTPASGGSLIELSTSPILPEPSISCRRCGTNRIQYDVHYVCNKCDINGYALCLQCYRQGEGCLHWYGFGWAALLKYEKDMPPGGYPPGHEAPHILTASRYQRPICIVTETGDSEVRTMAMEHPSSRLQSGVFCDMCHAFANHWYWRCDICNDGEWGFCNSCVTQGRHCTHPLLSLQATDPAAQQTDKPAQSPTGQSVNQSLSAPLLFVQRMLTTLCDYCKYPIPPSNTRYHCPECNDGDYDMHANCYISLVKSGRISSVDGHMGWRRCLNGHRMVVLGFEDRDGGQKRIVVRDLVGGIALREEEAPSSATLASSYEAPAELGNVSSTSSPQLSPQPHRGWKWKDSDGSERWYESESASTDSIASVGRFPPDGGVGLRMLGKWGYYPHPHVKDELMFPKGAEIKEAANINGDWFWGVYAGAKGLLPGSYVRIISRG